ncbi:phosphoribosylformylglycinamidine synthase subunit PurL [Nitriliruptor alkaliphilus]|uniref:phosphoribosylformylglycinamidine synthase subunit PurL n=1 Tax=Nitriliruptor alkaliphilus TaxID=427918 RepID=UPI0012EEAA6D
MTPERARELGHELGLRGEEYDDVVATLGRVPTVAELGMYSVMWSEHCSYKSSKIHLRGLATEAPWVLAGPGENAGVIDVGDGLAVAFKIESHNHPSYVEPYQGAATGVGGILRDIFTMGARPIAVMDPLRFGDPGGWTDGAGRERPVDAFQRHLVDGVVRGVGGYGNCVGVPNIGGELEFDDTYAGNPLVNVLAIGVLPKERLQLAKAERVGDKAVLLGSATGRDGIGGASVLASQEFDDLLEDKRPNVQVGDPFAEKQLIECCLELYERDLVAGIQDMGAAGIACSTSELASKASMGMDVDLDLVHLRDPTLESWEILCSESQERMLALVNPDDLDEVLAIAARWGVPASVIGEVVEGDALVLHRRGEVIADLPARSLADEGPTYDRPRERPGWLDDYAAIDAESLTLPGEGAGPDGGHDLTDFALGFLASPNVATPDWITEQYDHLVLGGTVLAPGMGDAGVVRLPGSHRAVACATDGNGRWCELDPVEGTRRVVAEAFRNVACVGARPLATTNCLNFGNPERPEIMWQLAESIRALGEATRTLGVPVTGGNVSLYNETRGRAIHPTPVVGILGVIENADDTVDAAFEDEGDLVLIVGAPAGRGLAGSELQRYLDAPLGGVLAPVDLELEAGIAEVLHVAARERWLHSAHDIGSGGLLVTLAESAVAGDVGVEVDPGSELPPAQILCSEAPGRVVVTVPSRHVRAFAQLCGDAGVPLEDVGTVGGDRLVIGDLVDLPMEDVRGALAGGLAAVLEA